MAKKVSTKWQDKCASIEHQLIARIMYLVNKRGKESQFSSEKALPLKQDQMFAMGEGRRWLVEITADRLVDDSGYRYSFDQITLQQLAEIADNI